MKIVGLTENNNHKDMIGNIVIYMLYIYIYVKHMVPGCTWYIYGKYMVIMVITIAFYDLT